MKKILFVVSTLGRSGPTNQLYNLIKYLDKLSFKCYLITLSPEGDETRWNDFEALNVTLNTLNLSRLGALFFAKSKVKSLVEEVNPDIIHTQGIRADTLLSSLEINIPHVATIHNFPQVDYVMEYGFIKGNIMVRVHVSAMRRIDKLFACSNSVAKNLIDKFDIKNVYAIENGVDASEYKLCYKNSDFIKTKLGLNADSLIWIYVGHLSKLKDPAFLIKAWLEINMSSIHHLVFLGDGESYEHCKELALDSKNIHVIGRVNNVADYLQGSDFFLSASKSEGLPMAAIEAMAFGLPVLLSNIDAHKELLSLSPEIGGLFDRDCIESFTAGFYNILDLDYDSVSSVCSNLVENYLSAKNMSLRYQIVYQDTLGV